MIRTASSGLCYNQAQRNLNKFSSETMAVEMKKECSWKRKEKVVLVMGVTGTGKSRLSIGLATHFGAEIINSDKMQVYQGLDIITNKVTEEEQRGVKHHLLGVLDPNVNFTKLDFRSQAFLSLESIVARSKLPIIAGGSNTYIEALVDDEEKEFRSKFDPCFLWINVALPVLSSFVSERVDRMVEAGLVDEVRGMFCEEADYQQGIKRSIGVPEMDSYLRAEANADEQTRARLLEEAIDAIKANTCKLACCQLEKIHRLRSLCSWDIHHIDATEVFCRRGTSHDAEAAWQQLVLDPAISIVEDFLQGGGTNKNVDTTPVSPSTTTVNIVAPVAVPQPAEKILAEP